MIQLDDNGALRCPLCGHGLTHMERAFVAARRTEDGEVNEVTVDHDGRVRTHGSTESPRGPRGRDARRQILSLGGWCEACGGTFALAFTQHKGATFVEVIDGMGTLWGADLDPGLG